MGEKGRTRAQREFGEPRAFGARMLSTEGVFNGGIFDGGCVK
jgi:hypothetical protein